MTISNMYWDGHVFRRHGIPNKQEQNGMVFLHGNFRTVDGFLKKGGKYENIQWYNGQVGYKHKVNTDVREGFVYVIGNPAWPEWVKVGRSSSSRTHNLNDYNRCSPFRNFELHYQKEVANYKQAEKDIHILLENAGYARNESHINRKCEWFNCSAEQAIQIIESYRT